MRTQLFFKVSNTTFRLLLILGTALAPYLTLAQADDAESGWLQYERGFVFNKGVYRNFAEFRSNSPGIQAAFEERHSVLYVYNDSLGKMRPYKQGHWGYTTGPNIYIAYYGGYARLGIIGELSFFSIVPYTSPAAGVSISPGGVGVGVGNNRANSTEEYLLDLQTGKVIRFNKRNFEKILELRDPLLFEQYKEHKGKKKAKLFLYLNAYNDKHPVYFPE